MGGRRGGGCRGRRISCPTWAVDQERGERKTEATGLCEGAARDDLRERLTTSGSADAESQAASAQFTDVRTRTTSVGDEDDAALRQAGRSRSAVATEWAVVGSVSVSGEIPSGARLGPNNTFSCSAVVFTDGEVMVTEQRIN
ncbi:hypothetical protein QSJ19_15240 [Gordonia sp. ABSL11-1]|uniref:hypothetical protein n=1 Tax=Gordonia sp. ABSL11-1 TaxID=3053924 RepID=UPI002573D1CD|nr:hypothetical protein [Gordonia sp. ABSL11-1]MDL9946918.1 hypothetical protein [Gordonia sp. ABSL11-1]